MARFLRAEMWGMKPGCRGLPKGQEQAEESRGSPAEGEQGFDSPLGSAAVSRNNQQLKPQGPGLVRGKVSSRVGACCAWW